MRSAEPVLEQIRQELDDHRQAINENADEIVSNCAYQQALENKLAVLMDRVNELTLLVKGAQGSRFVFEPLNAKEKETFLAVYELTETQPYTTYALLARRLGISAHLVSARVTQLIEKGIPVIKRVYGGRVYISLDHEFRKQQAKRNLVGIQPKLSYWFGSRAVQKSHSDVHSQDSPKLDLFDEKTHSQSQN